MSKKTTNALKGDKSVKATSQPLGLPYGTMKLSELGPKVKATLGRTDNMTTLELCLTNDGSRVATIELTGTVLDPSDNSHQRLFIAGNHDVALPTVRIPAGKQVKVRLATCCMDKSLSGPAKDVEYKITKKEAPERDVTAARNWINARQLLAGTGVNTSKFALQGEYSGFKSGGLSEDEQKDARRKSQLDYVQRVCWAEIGA